MDKQTAQRLLDEMPDGTTHYDTGSHMYSFLKLRVDQYDHHWLNGQWVMLSNRVNSAQSSSIYTVEQLREIVGVTREEALQWCVDNIGEWPTDTLNRRACDGWRWAEHDSGQIHLIERRGMGTITMNDWKNVPRHNITTSNDDKPVQASDVLQRGIDHMKDRSSTYDSTCGERSMNKTVKAFNIITGQNLTEEQGWLFMEVLKQVRSVQGDFKLDNYEDLAAYAGLRAEAAHSERTTVNE